MGRAGGSTDASTQFEARRRGRPGRRASASRVRHARRRSVIRDAGKQWICRKKCLRQFVTDCDSSVAKITAPIGSVSVWYIPIGLLRTT